MDLLQSTDSKYILFGIAAIVVLYLILKLIKLPFKILEKIIVNGIMGVILLFGANYLGSYIGFSIGINIFTALVAGILGIPGVAVLVIITMFF